MQWRATQFAQPGVFASWGQPQPTQKPRRRGGRARASGLECVACPNDRRGLGASPVISRAAQSAS